MKNTMLAIATILSCASIAQAKTETAESLIANATANFQQIFAKTSGFKTLSAFEESLKPLKHSSILLQHLKASSLVEVVSYHNSSIRDSIAAKGFLNMYQVHSTGGSIDNEKLRMTAEANMLGLSLKEYKAIPAAMKAKSALLQAKVAQSGLQIPTPGNLLYGDDGYIFKSEKLAGRMTWTPQDSLDRYIHGNGISVLAVHPDNVMPEDRTPDMDFLGNPAKSWDQLFIPWTGNALLIPYILPYTVERSVVASSGIPYVLNGAGKASKAMKLEMPTQKLKTSERWTNGEDGYVEVQIWGTLTLEDVEAFQFSQTPPSGAFLQALLARGIEIRDARVIPATDEAYTLARPKIWKPGQE